MSDSDKFWASQTIRFEIERDYNCTGSNDVQMHRTHEGATADAEIQTQQVAVGLLVK